MYWNDKQQVLKEVKKYGRSLKYASDVLKNDKIVVLEAVKNKGMSLKYASDALQDDKEIVLEAVNQNENALQYASENLKNDKEFVLEVVKKNGLAVHYLKYKLENDKEIALEAVKQNGLSLQYVSHKRRKDKGVVLEAVKQNSKSLEYADETLRKDKEFILEAIKQTSDIFLWRCINNKLTGKELNSILPDLKLRKKITDTMEMRGFKYQIGVNTDINKFNTETDCCAGGLYFSSDKYISNFLDEDYGCNIYEVKIPDDAEVYLEDYNKGKANKIELVKKLN